MALKRWTLWSAAVMAAALVSGLGAVRAEAKTIRFATLAPDGSAWVNLLKESTRKLEEKTEGRIKTKLYPGGVQGDEKDVVRKMKGQQLDGAALTTVGLSLIYPGIRVLQLPFLFRSTAEVDYVRSKMWPYFVEKFQAAGFRLMYPGDVGWTYLYSNKKIVTWKDLQSVKFWAWADDPIVRAFFKGLGVKSVPLGVPEVLSALKTGRIDGAYGSPLAAVALQWYREIKYAAQKPVGYSVGAMVMRYDVWDSASDADKRVQNKIGTRLGKKLLKRVRKDNKRAMKAMKNDGVTFTPTSDVMTSRLEGEAKKIWQSLVADGVYLQEELDMVRGYLTEFRTKTASR